MDEVERLLDENFKASASPSMDVDVSRLKAQQAMSNALHVHRLDLETVPRAQSKLQGSVVGQELIFTGRDRSPGSRSAGRKRHRSRTRSRSRDRSEGGRSGRSSRRDREGSPRGSSDSARMRGSRRDDDRDRRDSRRRDDRDDRRRSYRDDRDARDRR